MEHKLKKFLKHYWAILWIILAAVALMSVIALGAYTKTNRAKSVVARYGTVSSRFSSNYLEEVNREKPIYVTSTDGKFGDTVLISNFAQTNPTYHYDTLINYKLEMKLGYMNGTDFTYINGSTDPSAFNLGQRYITATVTGNNGYSSTIKFGYNAQASASDDPTYVYENTIYKNADAYLLSLPGTMSISDTIALEFSSDQKQSLFAEEPTYTKLLYLEIVATPDPISSYTGLSPLSARICLAKSAKVESITWTGDYNENKTGTTPNTLDGYNYVIQGMGSGTAQLKWKSDFVEISEQFLIDELGITVENLPVASGGYKSVTFTVNSNIRNRYDLQLYRTGTQPDTSYDTWGEMEGYVEFTFPYVAP